MDDVELLAAYQFNRDESAFMQLVDRHSPWIYTAARRRLKNDHLADDATQDVFIILATKAAQLLESKRGSLSAWLFHVMHFTCARLWRSHVRHIAVEKAAGLARSQIVSQNIVEDSRLLELMEDSIAQLPALEREIIVRRIYQRQRFAEVGKVLDLSADAVRKRLDRSLVQIRHLMLRDGGDLIPDAFLMDFQHPAFQRVGKRQFSSMRINSIVKEQTAMITIEQQKLSQGGHQMISAEFLVRDVETNLDFFEKLGFPRRFVDIPNAMGRIPRASLTAGHLGKIWIRRADESEIHPSPSINLFFWIDGGPEGLIAHRRKIADMGVPVTSIVDEHGLPNFNVTTPDGYSIAFFTQYVEPSQPPVVLVL